MQETLVWFLGQEDPLEKGEATHSRVLGLPLWLSWQRIHLQCGRPGCDPWVGKIPWKRERLPTPVFWPGEFHGLQSTGLQRVRHDWVTFTRLWGTKPGGVSPFYHQVDLFQGFPVHIFLESTVCLLKTSFFWINFGFIESCITLAWKTSSHSTVGMR